ncbi:MAG: ABC transporter ATP-binding protein [Candidatus Heimdallarchaeota archaeon]|nr:ABC transporter ATP-binding protein [Candidatus Heimdallarchaeota archaeon]
MRIISVSDLKKVYNKDIIAIDGVNLEINEGEVFGFLGPNGAGKSTTINIMTGKLRPTSGTVVVMGHTLPQDANRLAPKIGYVPQELVFFEYLTIQENLTLFASCFEIPDSKARITEVMNLLQIDDLKNRRSDKLSGGQKRRLNLAIGLIHKPEILFLDEPSAGMDPQSRNILWESIEKMAGNEKITIILTTHLMETAERLSDRIAIIDHGKIQAIDTPQGLKKKYGVGDIIELEYNADATEETINSLNRQIVEKFGADVTRLKDAKLSISSLDGVNTLIDLSRLIEEKESKSAIKLLSIHESSLEDVFIKITGTELREDNE